MRSFNNLNSNYNGANNNNYNSSSLTPSSSGSRVSRNGGDVSSTQSSDFEDSGTNGVNGSTGINGRHRGKLATVDSFSILERSNNNLEIFGNMTSSFDERLDVRISSFDDTTSSAYRLTPTKRSHRNTSFAIMTELPPKSRSPSPPGSGSGRVSPFRGRGFRAGGSSRHTTPSHSPPPSHSGMEIFESTGFKSSSLRNINRAYSEDGNFVSKIPMPIYHREGPYSPNQSVPSTATHRPRMSSKLSRSMSNLSSNTSSLRPPSSPSKKSTSFSRLSPIIGTPKSSPEVKSILKHTSNYPTYQSKAFKVVSDDSLDEKNSSSSQTPSKIPRSTSFIQVSKTSTPDRGKLGLTSRTGSRKTSPIRGSQSRIASREPSPSKRNRFSREPSPTGKPPRGPSRATSPNKSGANSRIPSPSKTSINKHISRLKAVQPPHKQFNSTNRSKSPSYLRTNQLNSSNNNSNKLTPKPVRRGPSPNRLNVPKEKIGNKSREPSPNRNKTPKPTTRIPYKTNNTYKSASSKIDSLNSFNKFQRKPKLPPKPQFSSEDMDNESMVNNQTESTKKLPKSSNSKQNEPKHPDDLTDSDHEVELDEEPESKPVSSFAETIQSSANNVVSATTETATVPLHIEAPKPQITSNQSENLLAKSITDSKTEPKPTQSSSVTPTTTTTTSTVQNLTSLSMTQTKSNSQTHLITVAPVKTPALPDPIPENSNTSKKPEIPKPITIDKTNEPSKSIPSPTEVILGEKIVHSPANISAANNSSGLNNNKSMKKTASFDKNSITSSLSSNQNNSVNKDKVVIVSEKMKPIQIQVKEKGTNLDVQSGNVSMLSHSASNGTLAGVPRVSPEIRNDQNQIQGADSSDPATTEKPPFCSRLFSCCKSPCCKKQSTSSASSTDQKDDEPSSKGCFSCCRKKPADSSSSEAELHPVSESNMESGHMEKRTCWKKFKDVVCCSRKNKVADMNANRQGCCSRLKCCRKKQSDNWAERRESVLSTTPSSKCCPSWNCCRRKRPEPEPEPESRRTSLLDKKKSLTPTVQPEKKKEPSIDESLVEHTSQMRGAIPVLPVPLAWFCLILNCILPGTGTIISGALCLCFGKPRFSVHDGPRMRVGAFIIDLIIGVSQAFTVLFCLVGWGWSIWWGVIMIKVARKHRKMKAMGIQPEGRQRTGHNNPNVDIERGQT